MAASSSSSDNIIGQRGRGLTPWERKRILILGTTYPAYSSKYTELVCTGGIEETTKRMVRIHPVPKRYLDEEQAFKTFQWIEGDFQPNRDDPRPESIRVDFETITVQDEIPSREQDARRVWIENSPSLVRSVEELEDLNARTKMSLGAIVPKSIDKIRIRHRTEGERQEWIATERRLLDQRTLEFVRPPKKLDFPEAEFLVTWTCDDRRCTKGHTSGIKSWPLHQGYRRLAGDPDRDKKTEEMMWREFDLTKRDVFFFLGTFHNHQTTFGLMDAFRPRRRTQLGLFAGDA